MDLPQEIMKLLRQKAEMPHDYINPFFLSDIITALENYYDLEDDVVRKWVDDMFGA